MNDEQLIELVRNYSVLYDVSHQKYMDSRFKLDIWNKIGKEMNADGASCRSRWNNMRDNYRKSFKKLASKSWQCAKKIKVYKYSEQLSFLNKYFDERETTGNIDNQKDKHENQGDDTQHHKEKEKETHEQDLASQSSPTPKRKNMFEGLEKSTRRKAATKKVTAQQTPSAKFMEYLIKKNEIQAATSTPHPVDAFLAGVAPTLKALTPYYLNLAKSEIFSCVQKYEMKMLMEQQSHERSSDSDFLRMTPHSEHYSTSISSASTPLLSPAPTFQDHIQNPQPFKTATPISTDSDL